MVDPAFEAWVRSSTHWEKQNCKELGAPRYMSAAPAAQPSGRFKAVRVLHDRWRWFCPRVTPQLKARSVGVQAEAVPCMDEVLQLAAKNCANAREAQLEEQAHARAAEHEAQTLRCLLCAEKAAAVLRLQAMSAMADILVPYHSSLVMAHDNALGVGERERLHWAAHRVASTLSIPVNPGEMCTMDARAVEAAYAGVPDVVGGMGEIVVSHDTDGTKVALKRARMGHPCEEYLRGVLRAEGYATALCAQLPHPNVMGGRLLSCPDTGTCVVASDWCQMGALDAWWHVASLGMLLKPKSAHLAMVRRVGTQLLSGVNHLHAVLGVEHCDLNPTQVLVRGVDSEGIPHIAVADLGQARHFGEELMPPRGTPGFASPETLMASRVVVAGASDIWACGLILWTLLSDGDGEESANGPEAAYFKVDAWLAAMKRGLQDPCARPFANHRDRLHALGAPEALHLLLDVLLDWDPAKRPTAERALEMLQWALAEYG